MKKLKFLPIFLLPFMITGCNFYETESSSVPEVTSSVVESVDNNSSASGESKSAPINSSVDNRTRILSKLDAPSLDGKRYDMSLFKGQLTLLNMWGTYCGPCKTEMPYLAYINSKYDHFQVVGVLIDITDRNGNVVASYKNKADQICADAGVTYPSLLPCEDLNPLINSTEYIPYSVFIDENGYQVGEAITGSMSLKDWDTLVEKLMLDFE